MDQKTLDLCSQSARLQTFTDWPFTENCSCTPIQMAEAGFYHCPTEREPDLVLCYVCGKELDGWDPYDDPWEEHRSHSAKCPFVLLGKKMAEMTCEEFLKMESVRYSAFIRKYIESTKAELLSQAEQIKANILI